MVQYNFIFCILIATFLLYLARKNHRVFAVIAMLCPIATGAIFYNTRGFYTLSFLKFEFTTNFSDETFLLGMVFLFILFISNSYALARKRYFEVMMGGLYCACSLWCLVADDFISTLVALELMMLMSATIIFIGGSTSSIKSAKKYFITHLFSGNCIIIGVAYIITSTDTINIVQITDLINNNHDPLSQTLLALMLLGMIINIASFPFSGWMVEYYVHSSSSGFMYLISFTTKISIILIAKTLAHYEPLKYIAFATIAYAAAKSILEDNLRKILCYLSIIQISFLLLSVASGNNLNANLAWYLSIHILYKCLISLIVAILEDYYGITACSNLNGSGRILIIPIVISITAMINVPFSSNFAAKSALSADLYTDNLSAAFLLIASIMPIISMPWYQLLTVKGNNTFLSKIHIPMLAKIALYIISTVTIILLFRNAKYHPASLHQIAIITISIIAAIAIFRFKRTSKKAFNILETIVYYGLMIINYINQYYFADKSQNEEDDDKWVVSYLLSSIKHEMQLIFNQQTAILIVFSTIVFMFYQMATP
jgi:multicomponent Na+:H+ antiporter subunit D